MNSIAMPARMEGAGLVWQCGTCSLPARRKKPQRRERSWLTTQSNRVQEGTLSPGCLPKRLMTASQGTEMRGLFSAVDAPHVRWSCTMIAAQTAAWRVREYHSEPRGEKNAA